MLFGGRDDGSGGVVRKEDCSHFHTDTELGKTYDSLYDVIRDNKRLGQCCNPIRELFKPARKKIDQFCKTHGMKYEYLYYAINVSTQDGKWIIGLDEQANITLFHKNAEGIEDMGGTAFPGYHVQNVSAENAEDYFNYIYYHDKYRRSNPVSVRPQWEKKKAEFRQKASRASVKERRAALQAADMLRSAFDDDSDWEETDC